MTKFQVKITTAFATGAVLLNALAPFAFAETSLTITGNGTGSSNDATVSSANTTTLTQTNSSNINNNVNVNANTGNNKANDNTGGDVTVHTGDALTSVKIDNMANSNAADITNCNCNNDASVLISGNGSHSSNNASLDNSNTTALFQTNAAAVTNNVNVDAKTGNNKANDNTGGDVLVHTGDASTIVNLATKANANTAMIGGTGAGAHSGGISAIISGNGTGSDNTVDLKATNDVLLEQLNAADINNVVGVDANTGKNQANDNTGGDVTVWTGDAYTKAMVDNMVNFNAADVDSCSCLTDLTAKIAGNGSDSSSDLTWDGANTLAGFQTNASDLNNDLSSLEAKTGSNHASDNTGAVSANDPYVHTGGAATVVDLSNSGNANTFGSGVSSALHNVDFSFDFGGLLAFFMGHSL